MNGLCISKLSFKDFCCCCCWSFNKYKKIRLKISKTEYTMKYKEHIHRHISVCEVRLERGIPAPAPAARCARCVRACVRVLSTGMQQWRDQAYPLWQSLLSPIRNWVVQFTRIATPHPPFWHTLTWSHTHSSDRLLDKPLTFTLQSLRSISRPFFHVMFTSLWAIWPQWGDCLWSTTCVHNGHFPRPGQRGEAIKGTQRCLLLSIY